MIQRDAVSELLIEKRDNLPKKEFVAKLKQVQHEYESRRAIKG